ncbi:MAG: hypothetical protein WB496_05955, partial [Pseudolabrys sp.]
SWFGLFIDSSLLLISSEGSTSGRGLRSGVSFDTTCSFDGGLTDRMSALGQKHICSAQADVRSTPESGRCPRSLPVAADNRHYRQSPFWLLQQFPDNVRWYRH